MTEQSIRLRLENNGVQSDVAARAAAIIRAYTIANLSIDGNAFLINDFIALYRQNAETALEVLQDNLIDN